MISFSFTYLPEQGQSRTHHPLSPTSYIHVWILSIFTILNLYSSGGRQDCKSNSYILRTCSCTSAILNSESFLIWFVCYYTCFCMCMCASLNEDVCKTVIMKEAVCMFLYVYICEMQCVCVCARVLSALDALYHPHQGVNHILSILCGRWLLSTHAHISRRLPDCSTDLLP